MRIAITGTIGSGKTTVSEYIRSLGYEVFDCDAVNAEILEKRGYELLKDVFPECFFDNILDKEKLADVVFNDQEKKKQLENILHPIILEELEKINNKIVIAEVPLLFEVNWNEHFDVNVLVVADRNIAISRLEKRGLSYDDAVLRISNQMSTQEKIKKADRIIYNNGSLSLLYAQVDLLLSDLKC